jgi:hypothetical protein
MMQQKLKGRERALHSAFRDIARHCAGTADGRDVLAAFVRVSARAVSSHPLAPLEMMAREVLGGVFAEDRAGVRRGPTPVHCLLAKNSRLSDGHRRALETMLDDWDDLEVGIGCTAVDPAKVRVDGGPGGAAMAHERVLGGRTADGARLRRFLQEHCRHRVGGEGGRDYLDPGADPRNLGYVLDQVLRKHVGVGVLDRKLGVRKGTVMADVRWAIAAYAGDFPDGRLPPSCRAVQEKPDTRYGGEKATRG